MPADPVLHPQPPSWPEDKRLERGFAVVLVLIAILAVALSASGCVSAETRQAAVELEAQVEINRRCSEPAPGIDPAAWVEGQDHAAGLARRVKEALR